MRHMRGERQALRAPYPLQAESRRIQGRTEQPHYCLQKMPLGYSQARRKSRFSQGNGREAGKIAEMGIEQALKLERHKFFSSTLQ